MFIDLLRKRRSIRQFQQKPVEQEKIDILTEAVLRSPSSRSLNPWEFIVVQDKKSLELLSQAKPHGAAFLKNAPLAIVVCADPAKSDVWVEDCSIASILLHLAATDLGLGSCWIQLRLREYTEGQSASKRAAEILGLADGLEVQTIIAIGYSAKETQGHDKLTLLTDRLHAERFGGQE
ncbi:MAG: NAD(P)H-dependent dehydrogenase/reductase [Desulfocapsa sp.]|nr:MAG: NAD(P)H-dependent dehydrogenase/reductase [Desulfocapsa sp.]